MTLDPHARSLLQQPLLKDLGHSTMGASEPPAISKHVEKQETMVPRDEYEETNDSYIVTVHGCGS